MASVISQVNDVISSSALATKFSNTVYCIAAILFSRIFSIQRLLPKVYPSAIQLLVSEKASEIRKESMNLKFGLLS